jgi:ATP/ADP translocase
MYFQRALVVSTSVRGPSQRTAFFAALNTWSAACILLMQLFATSSLLRYLGMQVRNAALQLTCHQFACKDY